MASKYREDVSMEEDAKSETKGTAAEDEEDPRLEFMFSYLQTSLRLKPDKWAKLLGNKESAKYIHDFLQRPDIQVLVLAGSSSGVLQPMHSFPSASSRSKSCYFIRKTAEPVTKENFRNVLIFGDVAAKPVDQLAVVVQEVFVPLLSNPKNQSNWPRVVTEDVMKHIYELKNVVYEVRGKLNGQTLLPMPIGIERVHEVEQTIIESKGKSVDLYLKSAIEGIVIKWAIQIDEVLKEDSSCAFVKQSNPTPRFEIDFWNSRLKNLECIYDQLRDPRVKKMASILQLTDSAYFSCFKMQFHNIVAAVTEARDITLYLKPLVKHFDLLENTDFKDAQSLLRPLVHCVALVWANSRYYCTSNKIITLIREIANLLIQEATRFLDPGSLFHREIDETREHVENCIKMLVSFRTIFEEYQSKLHTFFPKGVQPIPWVFHPRAVFERMIQYVNRLKIIENFFATSMEFLKLEKVEIGGLKGRLLGTKVAGVLSQFHETFAVFGGIVYDPLDPEDEGFVQDYALFMEKVEDMDRKLAAIFCQAFDDCHNLDSIYKLIFVGGSLLHRPIIKALVTPKYNVFVTMLGEEMATVKEIFDRQVEFYNKNGYMTVDKYLPPVAGALHWIHKLRQRIVVPTEIVKELELAVIQSPDFHYQIHKYNVMRGHLDELEGKIFSKWTAHVPEQCVKNLEKPLMIQEEDTLELSLNFDNELVAILREVHYLKMMDKEGIPIEALTLFDHAETLHQWTINLNRVIEWYNNIRQNTLPVEYALIDHEIQEIDSLISEVLGTLTWNSENVWTYVQQIRTLVEDLQGRILKAQLNVEKIHNLINTWSLTPLFERKDCKKENLIFLDDHDERVARRYKEMRDVSTRIHQLMDENYRLFFNIKIPELEVVEKEPSDERRLEAEEKEDEEYEDELGKGGGLEDSVLEKDKLGEVEVDGGLMGVGKKISVAMHTYGAPITVPLSSTRWPAAHRCTLEVTQVEPKHDAELQSALFLQSLRTAEGPECWEEEEPMFLNETESEYPDLKPEMQVKWKNYEMYVDDIVSDGLFNTIACSMSLFMDEMEPGRASFPLCEVALHLQEPNIVFVPTLNPQDSEGFYHLIESLLNDIMQMSHLVRRVTKYSSEPNYKSDMDGNSDLKDMITETLRRVHLAMTSAVEYRSSFDLHSYLWLDDRHVFLKQFLIYGHQLSPEELEIMATAAANEEFPGLKENPSTTSQFKEQIDYYDSLYAQLEKMENEKIFDTWFKVDVRPFKQALLNAVCKWGNLFKQHLVDHVTNSLQELEDFITDADKGLLTPVQEGDYEGLLRVMGFLYHVRERQVTTDEMFGPIREIINMLKIYDVEFSEETYLKLQELPEKWTNTKKIAITVKQNVAPLMAAEVTLIRKRITFFDIRQTQFRETFRKSLLFKFECPTVYTMLDKTDDAIIAFETEMATLAKQASLFDVNVPDFKQLKMCRKEIKMLKTLWDYVHVVRSCMNEWKKTPWKKIDVENMDVECKKYSKEIRALDKDMRGWNTYIMVESMIKNILTALRAVTELQNPAIRERHWQQLMAATKCVKRLGAKYTVKFVMADKTTLADLLALNLHEYEEDVKSIVDQAVKEMSMEKVLKELNATWSGMQFEKEIHPRTNCTVIRASEELIETLEENQESSTGPPDKSTLHSHASTIWNSPTLTVHLACTTKAPPCVMS